LPTEEAEVKTPWFDVDKEGLAKILERKGKKFAIAELLANAFDQNVTRVDATLEPIARRPAATFTVTDDDPDGFKNLTHAYTLFAESEKKGDPNKSGRFNIGEKLVLAVCDEATITSTTGGVRFNDEGRSAIRKRREAGSEFRGTIRMTRAELEECVEFARTIIPPQGVCTMFNGEQIQERQPKATFELALETHLADEDGVLRKVIRTATVNVYEPLADEIPSLYELGIPVVETDDKWHIDVRQKVPLSLDRDNVPPAYLRKLRAAVVNHLFQQITPDDASQTWVKAATEAPEATREAVNHVVTQIYGVKRAIYDPTDPEANKRAVSEGFSIIHGGSLSSGQWDHIKEHKIALPAGQIFPTRHAEFSSTGVDRFVPPEKYTAGMRLVVDYSSAVASRLGIPGVKVLIINSITDYYGACYGDRQLIYNVGRLGYSWFDGLAFSMEAVDRLLLHELAHEFCGDHLSEDFHEALCKLGAKLKALALNDPEFFERYEEAEV
jgi:hypothetical protein